MKPFMLESKMLTMGGVFYPTGYVFAMFQSLEDADKVDAALQNAGFNSDDIMLLRPEAILNDVSPTVPETAGPMPSVGSEAATVRKYTELARQGHCALLIPAASAERTERLMDVMHQVPFSMAEKYHFLAMERLH
ncbi:MAG: RNA-binding protein [Rubrivivax sp.]|nr:MAG: RNA-binding protein [Rubrivivax sp.]